MSVFYRLKEAEEFIANKTENDALKIFSFQVSINGGRKFKVMSYETFWDIYEKLDPKYYYEVVRPLHQCKLFFDLEYEASVNPGKDGHSMVSRLIKIVNQKLHTDFGHINSEKDVLVLESFHKSKFSIHLVFLRTVFQNIQEVGGFVKQLTTLLEEEDRKFLSINQNGQEQLFIDMLVYKSNQQFRLFMSRKMGRMNPLLISTINSCDIKVFNKNAVLSSLLTNVDKTVEVINTDYNSAISCEMRYLEPNSTGETPFKEIDDRVKEIISPGRITGWTYHPPSETYCYSVENYSKCQNVGRSHRHSKVYFLFCVKNLTLWQQCFKCRGYKSDPIQTPDFSWLNFEAWE